MLSVLLITSVPARAGSIQFTEVVQAIVDGQTGRPRVELRLRSISQSGRLPAQSGTAATSGNNTSSTNTDATNGTEDTSTETNLTQTTSGDPVQEGTTATGQVEVVDLGDVTGTVCDCGEIKWKGGFPMWPLLALGAIPLFFIPGDKCVINCEEIPPCVDCNPPQVPEPATLLLFGSGMLALSAGARRRRARRKLEQEINVTEEV